MSRETDFAEKQEFLTRSFLDLGIDLSALQTQQLLSYYTLLTQKNKIMNLTTITRFDEVVQKHFLDSALISKAIDMNSPHSLIDVGSGAGFPGIPLKILYPGLEITLLDSLKKRVQFLCEVTDSLELKQIFPVHNRAEDAARDPDFRESFDLCVSRAVANLSVLTEYCLPFVRINGLFVAYKSADIREECDKAKEAVRLLGGEIQETKKLTIPGTDIQRVFVVIRKIKETPAMFPRRAGIPQKSPVS